MVFIPNAGLDHRIWDYQLQYFSRTHTIYAIDLIGYGRSQKPELDYTLAFYTEMLTAFLDHHGLKDVILVGNCVGAAVALNYALENSKNVRYLFLINIATTKTLQDGAYGRFFRLNQHIVVRKLMRQIAKRLILPKWIRTIEIKKLYGKTGDPDASFRNHLQKLFAGESQMRILFNLLLNFDSFSTLDIFNKPSDFPPVMVVWGAWNRILGLTGGNAFAENFHPDKFRVITGCGHLVMRENHIEVNRLIKNMIRG